MHPVPVPLTDRHRRTGGVLVVKSMLPISHILSTENDMPSPTDIRPPFALQSAADKVRAAEDAWNSRDPHRVSLAYSEDSEWRNRNQFIRGRDEIQDFLADKWSRELDYRLTKSLWTFSDDRIAVRFQYEYHNDEGQWFRAYGNELWEFDESGLMRRREASINDVAIEEQERKFRWAAPGPRPETDSEIPAVR